MRRSCIAVCAFFLSAASANAVISFYPNYSTWKDSHVAERAGFVAGVIEAFTSVGFDQHSRALGSGLTECSVKLQLNTASVAEAITKHYENHPKDWGKPAVLIFWDQFVLGACLEYINASRSELLLEAWKSHD